MSRTWAVVRREFNEMVRTRAFLVGTILGPLFFAGLMAMQIVLARGGGGERSVVVVDATATGLGDQVAAALAAVPPGAEEMAEGRFRVEVVGDDGRDPGAVRAGLVERIGAGELDGFLWLPPGVAAGDTALYEGKNATNMGDLARLRAAVQAAVQGERLGAAGIDPAQVGAALRPVAFDSRQAGGKAASGTSTALMVLTYVLGLSVYMVVILYGQAVLRGVLEEKRDRIVEVVVSSIHSNRLLMGKVLGLGGAGIFQVLIWVACAALVLTRGGAVVERFGGSLPELPSVPPSVGVIFVVYFLGGFFLYASLFAAMGAIATTDQEAQQLQFPVVMLLALGILMMPPILNDPDGATAVAASLIPFTAPVVMPMRAAITAIPPLQLAGSIVLLAATVLGVLRIAAKIYRIGILATGKRPSAAELWRWIRTA